MTTSKQSLLFIKAIYPESALQNTIEAFNDTDPHFKAVLENANEQQWEVSLFARNDAMLGEFTNYALVEMVRAQKQNR